VHRIFSESSAHPFDAQDRARAIFLETGNEGDQGVFGENLRAIFDSREEKALCHYGKKCPIFGKKSYATSISVLFVHFFFLGMCRGHSCHAVPPL
jgi:hypothetical protein